MEHKYSRKSDGRKMPASVPIRPIIKNIAFFGDADVEKSSELYRQAYDVAKLLAEHRYTIVNGGGPGVMDASTKGAEEAQGETIAVTFAPKDATGFEGRYVGNVTDQEVKTSNYIERMFKLMEHADAFIIFKGGTGTISELGTAWVLAKLYYGHHKPFILYGKFWKEIIAAMKENMNLSREEENVFVIVESKEEVLENLKKLEADFQGVDHSHCRVCEESAFMS